ncbi:hypothetical protein [Pantanalinema sp. GBBB05]|uniref:hypothetical protein n=1 Tax=Pantanalinema sp. GBBB05 TaxID=2604139 RepID=UPI001E12D575|nr:hypothetical protein [Pantanalinema sp. GBBB05]
MSGCPAPPAADQLIRMKPSGDRCKNAFMNRVIVTQRRYFLPCRQPEYSTQTSVGANIHTGYHGKKSAFHGRLTFLGYKCGCLHTTTVVLNCLPVCCHQALRVWIQATQGVLRKCRSRVFSYTGLVLLAPAVCPCSRGNEAQTSGRSIAP